MGKKDEWGRRTAGAERASRFVREVKLKVLGWNPREAKRQKGARDGKGEGMAGAKRTSPLGGELKFGSKQEPEER